MISPWWYRIYFLFCHLFCLLFAPLRDDLGHLNHRKPFFLSVEWYNLLIFLCSCLQKTLGLQVRKQVECCHWGFRAIVADTWKRVILGMMWTMETQMKRFHIERILTVGLETIFVIFFTKQYDCLLPLFKMSVWGQVREFWTKVCRRDSKTA